ncbi:MAG: hypothetical protein AB7Q81_17300 [Gammaproteobacteria bacterium]
MRHHGGSARACLLGLLLAAGGSAASASETAFYPALQTRMALYDNRRMRPDDSLIDLASITDARVGIVHSTPEYTVSLVPQGRISRYVRQGELDADDVFVDVGATRRFERDELNGQFRFERQTTLTTELTDSGVLDTNLYRTQLGGRGSWRHNWTERLVSTVSGGVIDNSYEELPGSAFIDFRTSDAALGLQYAVSPQTTWLLDLGVNRFDTPALDSCTVSYTYQFGIQHVFDQTLDATFRVGQNISRRTTRFSQPRLVSLFPLRFETIRGTDKEHGAGRLVNVLVSRHFERADLDIYWDRYFSPSNQGGRQQRQTVGAEFEWDMRERWTATWDFEYRVQDRESDFVTGVDALDVYETGATLAWQFTREISLEATYRFRLQVSAAVPSTASSNELVLALRYGGRAFDWPFEWPR